MGPFAQSGSVTVDIWAGAAKCDIKKGKFAGTGNVTSQPNQATITVNPAGFVSQVHIYIGTEKLVGGPDDYQTALPLVAENITSSSSLVFTYDLTGASGPVHVVFHCLHRKW
jgi:hypothetical protein